MLCKRLKKLIAAVLVTALLCGCGAHGDGNKTDSSDEPVTSEAAEASGEVTPEKEKEETAALGNGSMAVGERPFLMGADAGRKESDVVPCVESYTVEPDLSNVDNLWQFYLEEGMAEKLSENGFVVSGFAGNEFFEIYETNRYSMVPNFVTVDSMMHTYHLYFSYLLKNLEKDYLAESLTQLSSRMLAGSTTQYEKLKGSEWENAAKRNVAFFTVGTKLLDDSTEIHEAVKDTVSYELEHIGQASGIDTCQITEDFEDYSQYKPRGYYEGDEKLEAYFKAMMWYGRIHFKQDKEDLNRSALLITGALDEDAESYSLWESVYAVTSFFAGASDDCGVCEYAPVIREAYGDSIVA